MADKMSEVTDTKEAMAKLGYRHITVPEDAEIDDSSLVATPDSPVATDQESATTEPENALEGHSDGQQPTQTIEQLQAKLTDIEDKRRGWQSKAEKEKADREKIETELALLRQVALQNRALNQFVGQQAQPATQQQNPEPKLSDFVHPDDMGDITPADSRYQQYQQKREQWLMENAMNRAIEQFTAQQAQQQKQQLAEARARKLAAEFPEFTDPFTGQPDYVKIQDWMAQFDSAGDDSWVQLRRFQEYSKQAGSTTNSKQSLDPEQIERAASAPLTIATAPQATAPVEKEIPPSIKRLGKSFGNIVLPPDFDGLS